MFYGRKRRGDGLLAAFILTDQINAKSRKNNTEGMPDGSWASHTMSDTNRLAT